MCKSAVAFTGAGIGNWDTSNVVAMQGAFEGAVELVEDLSQWDTKQVEDLSTMFKLALKFNSNLGSWNTTSVTAMVETFQQAVNFEGSGLEMWDVSNVQSFQGM